jgi:hypothetical protein
LGRWPGYGLRWSFEPLQFDLIIVALNASGSSLHVTASRVSAECLLECFCLIVFALDQYQPDKLLVRLTATMIATKPSETCTSTPRGDVVAIVPRELAALFTLPLCSNLMHPDRTITAQISARCHRPMLASLHAVVFSDSLIRFNSMSKVYHDLLLS